MKEGHPQAVYLKDYIPPPFLITQVELDFVLGEEVTLVTSTIQVCRNPVSNDQTTTLELDGEELKLCLIKLDGIEITAAQYVQSDEALLIRDVPDRFALTIQTEITPQTNTSLEGLYKSSGNFCTQCEAQGFRKITYFLDRPDIMAKYKVRIQANSLHYPVLLSNGNLREEGKCSDGEHYAIWEDPFPKPSYLFALVAGNLVCLKGVHRTKSGKDIELRIYSESHNADKCEHALQSLKKAMQWDEGRFGLECDLDIYMIVAVDDFNMGAMENKGLNIFNSSCVLARPDTATDADYENIETVVAHEYFHNWTGNRVTCRDWFQLSLKEGLTVFRDQEFTAEVTSRAVKRIHDVRYLRSHQFAEDASPMAHPVRPTSYVEINNFYTLTVYEKGAEIVRMYQTMFGKDGFREGMDLYFKRHDGQAVTTDEFTAAIADANRIDLSQFKHWYEQAGTPTVKVKDHWNAATHTYQLTFTQSCPATPQDERDHKLPFVIPVKTSLLDANGEVIELPEGKNKVLLINKKQQSFHFENIQAKPLPDLLQEFSAPVNLKYDYSDEDLAFLLKYSPDAFNRWNAGNRLAVNVLLGQLNSKNNLYMVDTLRQALMYAIQVKDSDQSLLAELFTLPSEKDLEEYLELIEVQQCVEVCEQLQKTIAQSLEQELLQTYRVCYPQSHDKTEYRYKTEEVARRRLQNVCLQLLTTINKAEYFKLALDQFNHATNMTEQVGAVNALLHSETDAREQVLQAFEQQWQHDSLVMDKWFAFHARSKIPNALENVKQLMRYSVFTLKNPNKVRALIGVFAGQNALAFHNPNGSGYEFVAEQVLELDSMNPQVASRLARTLMNWKKYADPYQKLMYEQLEHIAKHKHLSKDVYEIVSKSL